MRVGIDCDGVLSEFVYPATKIATSIGLLNKPYTTIDQKQWNFDFDMEPIWNEIKQSYNWWMSLYPIISEEEVVFLNKVIKNHDIYFITARKRTLGLSAEMQTRYWLESIGIDISGSSVIATKEGTKGLLSKALDIENMIDDRPEGVYEIMEYGIKCYTRRWLFNDNDPLMDYVDSIEEYLQKINCI